LAEINQSHDVYGKLVASVNGSSFSYPVNMLSGSVSVSGSSGIRRKLSATIKADLDDAECDVFRTEIRAFYGIKLFSGLTVWTPQGTFVVTDAVAGKTGEAVITGEDRWRRIANARFLQPVMTAGNTANQIKNLVDRADSRIVMSNESGSTATHNKSVWERDRDAAIMKLATSIGCIVYFDVMGDPHLTKIRSLGETPDWRMRAGEGGTILDLGQGKSQGNTYNAAVVEGEDSSGAVAVRSVAIVNRKSSPLLYGGPFASRPRYFRSTLITTKAQADVVAISLLARISGMARTIQFEALPHPGLDAGDIVQAMMDDGSLASHMVDGFTMPLGPGSIDINTRTGLASDTDTELQ
jgi:hypothetical protein